MADGPDERAGATGEDPSGEEPTDEDPVGATDPAAGDDEPTGTDGEADLAARVAALERTVEGLRETVDRQRRDISYLAAAADIDSVEPVCPECGEGVLQRSSGLTWTQVTCPECGSKRYL
jgi:DNA-directed RNA polymerase subunit RPC12/RpoP